MAKKMLIDATHAEETRVVVVDGNKVEEFDFESQSRRQLAGNIYLAKVTRVEPSLQAAFVDYGGNRHGFLAFAEIHPDYYQIPVADREALLAEERAYAESLKAEEEGEEEKKAKKVSRSRRGRGRSKAKAADATNGDAIATAEVDLPEEAPEEVISGDIKGMEVLDLGEDESEAGEMVVEEGSSPMETVAETPVETPAAGEEEDEDADADDDAVVQSVDKDDTIESVAEEDDSEEVRPVRKPRPRKYKIQEVIKVRQIMLVQVVKEERGNKGAALTTYLSLAGRYCVLMPNTARGGGISRKITNAADRKKLKEIAAEIDVPDGAGLIIRTAGAQRTKAEIKRDYEYLQRMWEQIRELTLKSIAPAKIYEEGDLIKRTIRDLYSKEIDEVIVAGEAGYRSAKDFMKMIMPSHAKNVKFYSEQLPLFARYQVEGYLGGMFNPTVQLPSGGYIVIGITEALVAIDVNSGKATKEGSIEQTALKTNLEAAEEVARQLRLRDLAGLIVIDFIDMDERKNNAAVEKRLKDKLKTDRARIQLGRISGFGLLEMSRQRLRPGMLEATTQPCPHCHGTGLLRSDDNVALGILRQLEEEGVRGRSREVLVKAPVGIANFLMNQKREHIAEIEARYGMAVRIEADPFMVSPDYALEKFKTATRIVPEAAPVVTGAAALMEEVEDALAAEEAEEAQDAPEVTEAAEAEDDKPKKKRRRRRRRRGGAKDGAEGQDGQAEGDESDAEDVAADDATTEAAQDAEADAPAAAEEEPKPKKRTRSRKKKVEDTPAEAEAVTEAPAEAAAPAAVADEAPKKRTRSRKKKVEEAPAEPAVAEVDAAPAETPAEAEEKPKKRTRSRKKAEPAPEPVQVAEPEAETQAEAEPVAEPVVEPAAEPAPAAPAEPEPELAEAMAEEAPADKSDKPKRRGWWSMSR
ncbi:ribonuclease E/G [Loktanella sp. IMCC34160]|uniref:Rne/Rng family ribonuclease n=1 Tax=Loktanella sp. IMCC34160 TaxID=2510646 RepID=UPI00101CBE42|nr:ribonuclease E/G [Loktanella sp. IMCC34160]RYG91870.1 ribonuclease E/G [Loktanella sp. IMCC34160]